MSPETLRLLKSLLDGVQIHVGHPDFDGQVQQIIKAKAELEAELRE